MLEDLVRPNSLYLDELRLARIRPELVANDGEPKPLKLRCSCDNGKILRLGMESKGER